MALNLGLENLQNIEDNSDVTLSDVLASQLDFQEAYQAFTDYRNVCEIVVKAKASTESMEFASELLNASVENIQVSVETLGEKLKNAWDSFCKMWGNFYNWFKTALKKFANLFLKKADGTFKIGVKVQSDELDHIIHCMEEVVKDQSTAGKNLQGVKHTYKSIQNGEIGMYLTTNKQVKEWCQKAATAVKKINSAVKALGKVAGEKTFSAVKRVMALGSKIVRDLQNTITAVKDQTKKYDINPKTDEAKQ